MTATNPYLQGVNAALASRLLGIPYAVIITRDYDWDWSVLGKQAFGSVYPSRRLERAVGRWVLRHADLVLADREYYRQFAVRNGAAPNRAIATRVLADTAYAGAVARAPLSRRDSLASGPLLSYVGRLDADKFPLDLVDCLGRVQQRFPERVPGACAGTGAQKLTRCSRGRSELGVADHLRLLGSLDLADLPAFVASSDVFVAPHMGYTLIEAGLTGVPIVTYDYDFHGGNRDGRRIGLPGAAARRSRPGRAGLPAARRPRRGPRHGGAFASPLACACDHSLEAVVPLYPTEPTTQVLGRAGRDVISVAAALERVKAPARRHVSLARVYWAAFAFWVVTRVLVLLHQGAWPWMNSFVVDAARGIVIGDWLDAVRPQLPAVLGVPLVLVGANETQMVAALYMTASLVQFGAFLVLVRALFPNRIEEQTLALLVFLLVPYNHSIHHYRDMPVLLASSGVFLLSAHFVTVFRAVSADHPALGPMRIHFGGALRTCSGRCCSGSGAGPRCWRLSAPWSCWSCWSGVGRPCDSRPPIPSRR